jgi:rod shape-determining protein MreB
MTNLKNDATYVGIDLGTNTTFLTGSAGRKPDEMFEFTIPTIVGEIPGDSVLGVFDSDRAPLIGEDAIRESDYLNIRRPLAEGVISDIEATGIFFGAIHSRISKVSPERPVYAVIGIPAGTTERDRLALGDACRGIFEGFILAPEPFLAALGFRDDSRLKSGDYHDPVRNSLIIDIGAGTTDFCVIQGRYPSDKDKYSFPVAGDWIDEQILNRLTSQYPAFDLSIDDIRKIKEEHAAVQKKLSASPEVMIKGKKKVIDISEALTESISELLDQVFEATIRMVESSPSRMSEVLVKNIILTGGGSQIRFLDKALQDRLAKYGLESPECRSVGSEYWRLVGAGAYKLAVSAPREQWMSNF